MVARLAPYGIFALTAMAAGTIDIGELSRLQVYVVTYIVLALILGFWLLPRWLNANVPYDRALFGTGLFFFVFWIFINVHHYFLDTVMWRKGNPDVQRYLFAHAR